MRKYRYVEFGVSGILAVFGVVACSKAPSGPPPFSVAPAMMSRIGTVDERFQSYNVEMLEVTGGDFWKPYSNKSDAAAQAQPPARQSNSSVPAGMSPDIRSFRSQLSAR